MVDKTSLTFYRRTTFLAGLRQANKVAKGVSEFKRSDPAIGI